MVSLQPMTFLTTNGLQVSQELADLFRAEATKLFQTRGRKAHFAIGNSHNKVCGYAEIQTEFRRTRFADVHGIEFQLKVTLNGREFPVTFVVNEDWLNDRESFLTVTVSFAGSHAPARDPRTLN